MVITRADASPVSSIVEIRREPICLERFSSEWKRVAGIVRSRQTHSPSTICEFRNDGAESRAEPSKINAPPERAQRHRHCLAVGHDRPDCAAGHSREDASEAQPEGHPVQSATDCRWRFHSVRGGPRDGWAPTCGEH